MSETVSLRAGTGNSPPARLTPEESFDRAREPMIETKLRVLGQLALCKGCCCGKTERGLPAVPVDQIKAIWKMEKLNQTIQLTISGCLGPCDV